MRFKEIQEKHKRKPPATNLPKHQPPAADRTIVWFIPKIPDSFKRKSEESRAST